MNSQLKKSISDSIIGPSDLIKIKLQIQMSKAVTGMHIFSGKDRGGALMQKKKIHKEETQEIPVMLHHNPDLKAFFDPA